MNRSVLVGALLAALVGPVAGAGAAIRSDLISQPIARAHGLERAWFGQVVVDAGQARLAHVIFCEDAVYAVTDRATVQAFDAETGATLWSRIVGDPQYPTMAPSANRDFLAVINGSWLYVMNRYTGETMLEQRLDGAPGAGAALSNTRAYVPMISGRIFSYAVLSEKDAAAELGKKKPAAAASGAAGADSAGSGPAESATALPETPEQARVREQSRREGLSVSQAYSRPLLTQGVGRIMVPPIVTRQTDKEEFFGWTTNRAYLYVAYMNVDSADKIESRYRMETTGEVVAPLTGLPPHKTLIPDSGILFAGTTEGFVYAVRERNGATLWRFSAGEAIVEPCIPVGNRVFVPTELGGMYCLDAISGAELWFASGVSQVVAVSQSRVYATDRIGQLRVIDLNYGALLDTIDTSASPIHVSNPDNDRIYIATPRGLVQCLREIELVKPIVHRLTPAAALKPTRPVQKPAEPAEPGAGDDPFAAKDDPFAAPAAGPPAEEPAMDQPADAGADPFAAPAGGGGEDPFAPAGGAAMGGNEADAGADADADAGEDPFK